MFTQMCQNSPPPLLIKYYKLMATPVKGEDVSQLSNYNNIIFLWGGGGEVNFSRAL